MSDSLLRLSDSLLRLPAFILLIYNELCRSWEIWQIFSRTVLFMLRTMLLYEMMGIGGGGLCYNNCDDATFEHLGSQTKINYFETTIQCPVLRLPTRSK